MTIKYSTRLVILTKDKAYKIPLSYRGWLQGKNEKKVWDKYNSTGMLAPFVWEFFGIVCQTRVSPVESIDVNTVIDIKSLIPQFNFDNCDLHNPQNWGVYNGNKVLLDYGVDERVSQMY